MKQPHSMKPNLPQVLPGLSAQEHRPILACPASPVDSGESPSIVEQWQSISHDQFVAEARRIYMNLHSLEGECITIAKLNAQGLLTLRLSDEQWRHLITQQRSLLDKYYELFRLSQYPDAPDALKRLPREYRMCERLWKHGIESFLDLLQPRLPKSHVHMLRFIHLAYTILESLYEMLPPFRDHWIEFLGGVSWYRLAMERYDSSDREIWRAISKRWIIQAIDTTPSKGRLYHRLATIIRHHALQELLLYTKSLAVEEPFPPTREAILTLNRPLHHEVPPSEISFIKVHTILFTKRDLRMLDLSIASYHDGLDEHIALDPQKYIETGYLTAIINCSAELEYGIGSDCIRRAMRPTRRGLNSSDAMVDTRSSAVGPSEIYTMARGFSVATDRIVFGRLGDESCLGYIHVRLIWLLHLASKYEAMALLEDYVPWKSLELSLNLLIGDQKERTTVEAESFPRKEEPRPLPEDWALRGYSWTEGYFPTDWFRTVDEEARTRETADMTRDRKERILWLAVRLAKHQRWITYDDAQRHLFSTVSKYDMDHSLPLESDMREDVPRPAGEQRNRRLGGKEKAAEKNKKQRETSGSKHDGLSTNQHAQRNRRQRGQRDLTNKRTRRKRAGRCRRGADEHRESRKMNDA